MLENAVMHAKGMTRLCLTVAVEEGKRTGMGIGLFACSAIIRAHGSEIYACNRPESGTAFSFALDMEETNKQ